jgi:hypothetical protein
MTVQFRHALPSCDLMPGRLVAGPWTLNPADDVRIGLC